MSEGRKDDIGKLRYDLIPVYPLRRLAEVYTIGSKKYDDRNWEKGLKWGRVYAAMQRHATAFWNGEDLDPEDRQHHLASVAWCAFALMEYQITHPELDDRNKNERKCFSCYYQNLELKSFGDKRDGFFCGNPVSHKFDELILRNDVCPRWEKCKDISEILNAHKKKKTKKFKKPRRSKKTR